MRPACEKIEEQAGAVRLRFAVSDTGIGMTPERAGRAVRAVLPGRRLHHPPLRRHRPGPGDRQAADGPDGRPHPRGQPARARLGLHRGTALCEVGGAGERRAPRNRRTLDSLRVLIVDDHADQPRDAAGAAAGLEVLGGGGRGCADGAREAPPRPGRRPAVRRGRHPPAHARGGQPGAGPRHPRGPRFGDTPPAAAELVGPATSRRKRKPPALTAA